MRYILCEDSGSALYFWWAIEEYVLKEHYKMISVAEINKEIGINNKVTTLSNATILKYLLSIENKVHENDIYIICIDNPDTINVQLVVNEILKIVARHNNFHIFNYICFEELILAPGNYEKFIPNVVGIKWYNDIRKSYKQYGLGDTNNLRKLMRSNGLPNSSNIEKIFNRILERACTVSIQHICNKEYKIMKHHYICKGKWSYCWKTDCTPMCPDNRCWEATNKNDLMCKTCNSQFKGKSDSCKYLDTHSVRKYAEEKSCDLKNNRINVNDKMRERFRELFDIPEIREIDTW